MMQRSHYRITLDIRDSHGGCILDMKQTDNHRRLHIRLTDGGAPYQVKPTCYPVFTARKPDGTVIYNLCTLEEGTVIYDVTPQTTAAVGMLECELRLLASDTPLVPEEDGTLPQTGAKLLTSATFGIRVHPTVYNENVQLASATEVSALSQAVADARQVTKALCDAKAAGDFDGQDVTHHWEGSVLTLTSAAGTTHTDLRGPVGAPGEKGEKGEPGTVNIRDDTVGADAWSSQQIIKALCPAFRIRDTAVRCHPVKGAPVEILSGSSSEESDLYVCICGKNLYDRERYPMVKNKVIRHAYGTFADSTAFSATEAYIPAHHLRGKTISVRKAPLETNGSTTAGIAFYDEGKNYLTGTSYPQATVPEDASYLRFSINTAYAEEAQLELGDRSTDYEAYREELHHIATEALGLQYPLTGIVGSGTTMTVFAYAGEASAREVFQVTVAGQTDLPAYLQTLAEQISQTLQTTTT